MKPSPHFISSSIMCISAVFFTGTAWSGTSARAQVGTTNANVIVNDIGGTLPPAAQNYLISRPYVCVVTNNGDVAAAIAPGASGTLPYTNDNSAAIRMGGCTLDDSYVGWLDLYSSGNQTSINGFYADNSGYLWNQMAISGGHLSGSIDYTSVADNLADTTIRPSTTLNRKLPYVGVNLSGAEYGNVISPSSIPNLSVAALSTEQSDLDAMRQYVPQGLNTVRLPFSWGYLYLLNANSTIQNPQWIFNESYWENFLRPAIRTLTQAKITTILDLHTYMHYPLFGTQVSGCSDTNCPDGTFDTNPEHYKATWQAIWDHIKTDTLIDQNYIMFDLINEPVANDANPSEQLTPRQAFDTQMAVVTTLLNASNSFPGKILIEGSYWNGLHSWNEDVAGNGAATNAAVFTKSNIVDKLKAAHIDESKVDRIVISIHQYFDYDYSGTHYSCQTNLNTTGPSQFNLQPFADWLTEQGLQAMVTEFGMPSGQAANCATVLSNFTAYLTNNSVAKNAQNGVTAPDGSVGGFIGAVLWGGGHAATGDVLYVTPSSYQFTTLMQGTVGP